MFPRVYFFPKMLFHNLNGEITELAIFLGPTRIRVEGFSETRVRKIRRLTLSSDRLFVEYPGESLSRQILFVASSGHHCLEE